nr:hypothetical protein [Tanacetum cinerariifolium]
MLGGPRQPSANIAPDHRQSTESQPLTAPTSSLKTISNYLSKDTKTIVTIVYPSRPGDASSIHPEACMNFGLCLQFEYEMDQREKLEKNILRKEEEVHRKDNEISSLKLRLEKMERDVIDVQAKGKAFMRKEFMEMQDAEGKHVDEKIAKLKDRLAALDANLISTSSLTYSAIEFLMASLTLEGSHGEEDPSMKFRLVQPTHEHLMIPGYFERRDLILPTLASLYSLNLFLVDLLSHKRQELVVMLVVELTDHFIGHEPRDMTPNMPKYGFALSERDRDLLLRKSSTVSLTAGGDPAIGLLRRCKWVSLSVTGDHEMECTLRHAL